MLHRPIESTRITGHLDLIGSAFNRELDRSAAENSPKARHRTTLRTVQFRTDESLSTYIEWAELAIGPPANFLKNPEN